MTNDKLTPSASAGPQAEAVDRQEALAFEFYRFSYPNRWDWPHDRMWEDFQASKGSINWRRCMRSADAYALQQSPATDSAADQRAHLRDAERVSATDNAPAVGAQERNSP